MGVLDEFFECLQRLLTGRERVAVLLAIYKDELLLGHMDVINIIEVDNQALTNTHEVLAQFRQLVSNHSLYLSQLVGYQPHLAAGLEEIAVVAVRGDVQDVARSYT